MHTDVEMPIWSLKGSFRITFYLLLWIKLILINKINQILIKNPDQLGILTAGRVAVTAGFLSRH